MKDDIILKIPEVSMGENQWQRKHWAVRRKYQEKWDMLMCKARKDLWYLEGLQNLHFPIKKCTLEIIQHRKRLLDPDNLCVKFMVDSLVHQDIIIEDNAKVITKLILSQVKTKEEPFTEIIIRRVK